MRLERFARYFLIGAPVALGLWIIACLWFPLTDTDIWWHLASAKLIWAHEAFLRTDPFSQVSLGAPWIDLHWGFQMWAYGLWNSGGDTWLVGGKCLALLAGVGLILWPHWSRHSAFLLFPLTAFGVYHIRFYLDVRPLAVTLLILSSQYAVMQGYFQKKLTRPWLAIFPLQIILVNTQGLYPLGAFLISSLVLGEWLAHRTGKIQSKIVWRPWILTCTALWLCGFVSPYGWKAFQLPGIIFGRIVPVSGNIFSSGIAENQPFLELSRQHPWQALPLVCFVTLVLYTFRRNWERSIGYLLIFIAFTVLGLMAIRNLPLTILAGLMAAGHNLQLLGGLEKMGAENRGQQARLSFLHLGGGLVAFFAVVLLYGPELKHAWAYELPGNLETPFRYPSLAVDYLEKHPIPGPIFNELRYGGYLEFRMFPDKMAFVDGRMVLRTKSFYRDFLEVTDHPEGFSRYRDKYDFTHALLPISEDRRFLPLAAYLLRVEGWDLLHCDGASALLSAPGVAVAWALPLDSLPANHPIRVALQARFQANPRLEALGRRNVADFLMAGGKARAAQYALIP